MWLLLRREIFPGFERKKTDKPKRGTWEKDRVPTCRLHEQDLAAKALLKNEIITAPVPLVLRLEAAADPRTPPRPDGPSAASAASLLPVALAAVIAAVLLVARVRRDGSVDAAPRRDELM